MKNRLAPGVAGSPTIRKGDRGRRAEKVELPPSPRYVTAEALYHLLGGKAEGWTPQCMRWKGDKHWFLRQWPSGMILDPVAAGLWGPDDQPDYTKARGCRFLTKNPSKSAVQMMLAIVYGIPFATNIEMDAEYRRGMDVGLAGGPRYAFPG